MTGQEKFEKFFFSKTPKQYVPNFGETMSLILIFFSCFLPFVFTV